MAELFYSTADFKVDSTPRPDIPFLVDKNMESVDVVVRWFFYIALVSGKTKSKNTWKTYGNALYNYFQWLETLNKKWDTVAELDIASYRDSMIEHPNVNGKPCKPSTINHRITIIAMFYEWANKKGFIDKVPYEMVDVRVRKGDTFLKHIDATGGVMAVNELKLRTFKKEYEYLNTDQVKEVLKNLPTKRDVLIVCTILETGMRREEVVTLTLDQIPHLAYHAGKKIIPIKIIGKGRKERTVIFTVTLLQEIHKYILNDRRVCAKQYKEKHRESPNKLWLTKYGDALQLGSFDNILSAAGDRVGYRVYPHLFRHTFGYRYYAKTGDLVGLQKLMGHSSITTTQQYAHIDQETFRGFVEDVVLDIEAIYRENIEGYGE